MKSRSIVVFSIVSLILSGLLLSEFANYQIGRPKDFKSIPGKPYQAPNRPGDMAIATSSLLWDRENGYINTNIFLRQGLGPDLPTIEQKNGEVNPKAYKILLFGDSFVWGHGLADGQGTIGSLLQRELDEKSGSDAFNVIVKGESGDSTFRYVDQYPKSEVDALNPDVSIYAFYENDLVPNFNESMICGSGRTCDRFTPQSFPSYKKCVNGTGSLFSRFISLYDKISYYGLEGELLTRHCDSVLRKIKKETFDEYQIQKNPLTNPWLTTWFQALDKLGNSFSNRNFAVVNIISVDRSTENNADFYNSSFINAGLTPVSMNSTKSLLASTSRDSIGNNKLISNPANWHASAMLSKAIVEDMASYILGLYSSAQISEHSSNKLRNPKPLVVMTLPNNVISTNMGNFTSIVEYPITPLDNKYPTVIKGVTLPTQNVSCVEMNHSHIMLSLSKSVSNKPLILERVGATNNPLEVVLKYYDGRYDVHFTQPVLLIDKAELTPPNNSGLMVLIGDPKESAGCSTDKPITHYPFKITISTK